MFRVALVALFVCVASSARAQTVVADIDFSQLNLGGRVLDFEPVDDDGNPSTMAWLITLSFAVPGGHTQNGFQLIVQSPTGALCMEDPFHPQDGLTPFATFDVIRIGNRDIIKLVSSNVLFGATSSKGRLLSMDRVRCR